jgi:uncharacterized membrane protein YqiK
VLAVVGIVSLSSGVAYEGARLKHEETRLVDKAEARETRLVDKAEAREAHRAIEHKRELDKAEAEVKRAEAEKKRELDKAEAEVKRAEAEKKRELDKAEAEKMRLADKAEFYHYMAQVAGSHDYERLWRNWQETVKTAAAGGEMGKGKGED